MQKTSKVVETEYDDLTYKIIGCGMAVHRKLGPGLRENSYQRDLEIEFSNQNIPFQSQLMFGVCDKERNDVLIGYYIPDFIVDQKVIVEIKALR